MSTMKLTAQPTRGCLRTRRFTGIGKAAAKLGCSRVHLWHVLNGTRKSPGLLKKLRALA
jgi:hypothetical protein